MDRDVFCSYLIDGLLPIIFDEVEYIQTNYKNCEFTSYLYDACIFEMKKNDKKLIGTEHECYTKKILKKAEIQNINKTIKNPFDKIYRTNKLEDEFGMLYYLFDKHKNSCKESMNDSSITLDRHKIAAIFLCMLIEYEPIRFKETESLSEDIESMNYRIAFRFACYYIRIALFHSFEIKSNLTAFNNNDLAYESNNTQKTYKDACNIMKNLHDYPYFPMTRDGLNRYMDNYSKVLLSYFFNFRKEKIIYPYLLIADTFYLLDVYAKQCMGINVPFEDYSKNGLAHTFPNKKDEDFKELVDLE